jgi:hypothetical protein
VTGDTTSALVLFLYIEKGGKERDSEGYSYSVQMGGFTNSVVA